MRSRTPRSEGPKRRAISVGWWRYPSGQTVGGVYSAILNYSPWVEPVGRSGTATTAWVMADRPNTTNWAQFGWWEEPYDPGAGLYARRYLFAQWTIAGIYNYPVKIVRPNPDPHLNTLRYYTVLYNYVPGKFTFQYNGQTQNIDPRADFVPTRGATAGEIDTLASQMPGGTADPMWMADSHIWYGNAWRDFNGVYYDWEPGSPWPDQFHYTLLNPARDIGVYDRRC